MGKGGTFGFLLRGSPPGRQERGGLRKISIEKKEEHLARKSNLVERGNNLLPVLKEFTREKRHRASKKGMVPFAFN